MRNGGDALERILGNGADILAVDNHTLDAATRFGANGEGLGRAQRASDVSTWSDVPAISGVGRDRELESGICVFADVREIGGSDFRRAERHEGHLFKRFGGNNGAQGRLGCPARQVFSICSPARHLLGAVPRRRA